MGRADNASIKAELYNDNFQNYKKYGIPRAQLVIADIPYNLGNNAYGSNPMWYIGGDNKNGESDKAGKAFFNTDYSFNIAEYFHFCNRLLKKGAEGERTGPLHDRILCVSANSHRHKICRKIRVQELYTYHVHKELLGAGAESEYADCWSN